MTVFCMSEQLEQLGELVGAVREMMRRVDAGRLPSLLTQQMAAKEFSISLSKLKGLIRDGTLQTVKIGGKGHPMVSADEIRRCVNQWTREQSVTRPGRRRKTPPGKYDAKEEAAKLAEALKKRR